MIFKAIFYGLAILTLMSGAPLHGANKELDSKAFLDIARTPSGGNHWVRLSGSVMNRRRGADTIKASLEFATLFTGKRTLAQVIIDKSQGYMIGQVYGAGNENTSITPMKADGYEKPLLGEYGLRPDDLTMSFIYWDFVRELKRDTVKMQDCRVFELQSEDKSELVRVFFSAEYFFPLKVQWLHTGKDEPHRNLEVSAYRKVNNIHVPSVLTLYGPGWRTRVDFEDIDTGEADNIPKNLFR